jgi:hypothetical protein
MTKKINGKIIFSNEIFELDLSSSKKAEIFSNIKNNEKIDIINLSKTDILFRKDRKINHIDHFTLKLTRNISYSFENALSDGSYYNISFNNFSKYDNFSCTYNNGKININGEILFKLGIKDILYNDLVNSGLLIFDSITIRVRTEVLTFTKYGENWEQEKIDRNLFSANGDSTYLTNRPKFCLL